MSGRVMAFAAAGGLALAGCAVNGTVETMRDMDVAVAAAPGPVGHGKAAFMAAYDTNGDGATPRAEFDAERGAGFARRDADGDGSVSPEEYIAEFETRLTVDSEVERAEQTAQTYARFESLDDNEDGALSWAEFADSGDFVFGSMDSNGDGVVDGADTAEAY